MIQKKYEKHASSTQESAPNKELLHSKDMIITVGNVFHTEEGRKVGYLDGDIKFRINHTSDEIKKQIEELGFGSLHNTLLMYEPNIIESQTKGGNPQSYARKLASNLEFVDINQPLIPQIIKKYDEKIKTTISFMTNPELATVKLEKLISRKVYSETFIGGKAKLSGEFPYRGTNETFILKNHVVHIYTTHKDIVNTGYPQVDQYWVLKPKHFLFRPEPKSKRWLMIMGKPLVRTDYLGTLKRERELLTQGKVDFS